MADPEETGQLRRALGDALHGAGRHFEAAAVYRQAAAAASPEAALDLDRLAADNLLRSGHIEDGLALLSSVMGRLGARLSSSRTGSVAALLWQRARLAVRGLDFRPRPAAAVDAGALAHLDMLYGAAAALGMIDHVRGAAVQALHLRMALDVGEERRALRALAIESAYLASSSGTDNGRATAIADRVLVRARALDDPYLAGLAHLGIGGTGFFSGDMALAARGSAAAVAAFERAAGGVGWELVTARYFYALGLINIGDLRGLARLVDSAIEEADRRNDLYATNIFRCEPHVFRAIVRDDAAAAHRELDRALDGWPTEPYYLAHYQVALARAMAHLYEGDGAAARACIEEMLPKAPRIFITRMPFLMAEIHMYLGRAALQLGDAAGASRAAAEVARRDMPTSRGIAPALRATVAVWRGDDDGARALLRQAIEGFASAGAAHMVAVCRHRLGTLVAGDEGAALRSEVDTWMTSQGIANPARMLAFLSPGFDRPRSR